MAAFVPAALALYMALAAPRPYYLYPHGQDGERDYYYNGQLARTGKPLVSIRHPGTPIYYLAGALLEAAGPDPSKAQRVFNLGYLLIGMLAAACLGVFVVAGLHDVPLSVGVLAVGSVLASPVLLTYLNLFGPTIFVTLLAVPTLTAAWRILHRDSPSALLLMTCGALAGVCLAINISFAPAALALMGATAWHARLGAGSRARRALRWSVLPLATVAAFLVCIAPIIGRLPDFVIQVFTESAVRPRGGGVWGIVEGVGRALWAFADGSPVFLGVIGGLAGLGVLQLWRSRSRHSELGPAIRYSGLDLSAGRVFIALLSVGFLYSLSTSAGGDSIGPGYALRNAGPAALAVPFFLLYGFRAWELDRVRWAMGPMAAVVASALAVALVWWPAASMLQRRASFVSRQAAVVSETKSRLEALAVPGSRIAFATGDDVLLGEEAFHFGGNSTDGDEAFEGALAAHYPRYTALHLTSEDSVTTRADGRTGPIRRLARAVFQRWHQIFGVEAPRRFTALIGAQYGGAPVSVVAFPIRDIPWDADAVLGAVRSEFGAVRAWQEVIAGAGWYIIALDAARAT